ncbi:hypothetical protein CR155_20355 [Pollutimonas nitritireducens]|uniref:Uncharacterized protein n=1 Tax=Pollutimonas nitritireducens TaxID=2045209 RepID=A0A2N4UAH7_9BURK|nr:hypothetical protein CR155_20355 [Pollutimonas nitritireducens]
MTVNRESRKSLFQPDERHVKDWTIAALMVGLKTAAWAGNLVLWDKLETLGGAAKLAPRAEWLAGEDGSIPGGIFLKAFLKQFSASGRLGCSSPPWVAKRLKSSIRNSLITSSVATGRLARKGEGQSPLIRWIRNNSKDDVISEASIYALRSKAVSTAQHKPKDRPITETVGTSIQSPRGYGKQLIRAGCCCSSKAFGCQWVSVTDMFACRRAGAWAAPSTDFIFRCLGAGADI